MKQFILLVSLIMFASFMDELEASGQQVRITIGSKCFEAVLYDNATARAWIETLPSAIRMDDLNGNEKYFYLPLNLPILTSRPNTIRSGDIMLFGNNCLVLFYKTFSSSYSYSPIGRIKDIVGLEQALGTRDVLVSFDLIQPCRTPSAMSDETSLRLYLLQNKEQLHVSGSFDRLIIKDMQGKEVASSDRSPVQVAHLKSTLYVVEIYTGKTRVMKKFIK